MPNYRISTSVVERDEAGTERFVGTFATAWRSSQVGEIMFYAPSGESKNIRFFDNVFPPSPFTEEFTTNNPIVKYSLQAAGLNPNPTEKPAGQYIDVLTANLTALAVFDVQSDDGQITPAPSPPKLTVYTQSPAPTLTGRRIRVEGYKTFTSDWVNVGTAGYLKLHILPDAPYNSAAVSVGPSNASGDLPEEDSDKEIFEYNVPLQIFGLTRDSYLLTTERGGAYAYVSLSDVALQPIVDQLYSDGSVVAGTGLKTYLVQGTGTKLETPEITSGSHYDFVVSWAAVTHAKYYNVYVDGVLKATQEATTATVKDFGTGKYTVQALPDNDDQLYTASDVSEPFEIFGPYIRAYTGVPFLPSDNDVLIFENQEARDAFLDQYKVLDAPKTQTFYQHQARINLSCPNDDEYKDLRLCNYLAVYDGRRIFYYFITAVAEIELPAEDQPYAEQWPASFVADIVPDNWQTYAQRFDPDSNTYISAMSLKNISVNKGKNVPGLKNSQQYTQIIQPDGQRDIESVSYYYAIKDDDPNTLQNAWTAFVIYQTKYGPYIIGCTGTWDDMYEAYQYLNQVTAVRNHNIPQDSAVATTPVRGYIVPADLCPTPGTFRWDIQLGGSAWNTTLEVYTMNRGMTTKIFNVLAEFIKNNIVYFGTMFNKLECKYNGENSDVPFLVVSGLFDFSFDMYIIGNDTIKKIDSDFSQYVAQSDAAAYFAQFANTETLRELQDKLQTVSGIAQIVGGVAAMIGGGATGGLSTIFGTGTIVGGVQRIQQAKASETERQEKKNTPQNLISVGSGMLNVNYCRGLATFLMSPMNGQKVSESIKKFGYLYENYFVDSWDLQAEQEDFAFLQVNTADVSISAPAEIQIDMLNRFINGLRVWNNPDNFLNYGTE